MRVAEIGTRITLKNVVVATDFSPSAGNALPYAGDLAARYGAKLYVVHARAPVSYTAWPSTVDESCEIEMQQVLKSLATSLPGVQSESVIGDGTAWEVLATVLEKHSVDMIVVGTRGRTGLGKLLLGSQAEEILRRAPCPVLTVGPHAQPEKVRLASVLYATDFGPESQAAAPYAISIAQEHQAALTLLHVLEEPKAGELVVPADLAESTKTVLRTMVPHEAKFWCEPRCVVEQGQPAEKILDVAARYRADLIVLGTRRPTGVPGAATHLSMATIHQVVTHASCPVLTVRGG